MAEGQVFVIDRVVTRPGCGRRFVDAYLAQYAPGARARGMTLRDVLVSPPIWSEEHVNTITITWTLPKSTSMVGDDMERPLRSGARRMVVSGRRIGAGAVSVVRRGRPRRGRPVRCIASPGLLDVDPGGRERLLGDLSAAAAEAGAVRWVVRPTLPGSRNGGDILAHLRFATEDHWARVAGRFTELMADSAVTRVNGAAYSGGTRTLRRPPGRRLPRAAAAGLARHRAGHPRSLRARAVADAALRADDPGMATQPGRAAPWAHAMDPRVRAGVQRRRRADGSLPHASDPLGRGRSMV